MSQNNNDLFGYEDIFEDNKSKADFAALIGVIIRLILAITTGGFFYLFVGSLFDWLTGPLYSPYLSALTGVFCIDGLAYFWSKLRQRSGNTETQLTAATLGTIGNVLLSVLVTVVFIILLTDFVAIHDANGQLNDIGQAVNIAGLLIATIAIGGNGVLWAYYDANSTGVRQALSAARLAAARFAGTFAIEDRRNRMTIGRTIQQLQADLPKYTNDAAARHRAQYLLDNFDQLDTNNDGRLSDQELAQAPTPLTAHRPIHLTDNTNGNGRSPALDGNDAPPSRPFEVIVATPTGPARSGGTADTYSEAKELMEKLARKVPPNTNLSIYQNGRQISSRTTNRPDPTMGPNGTRPTQP